MLLTHSPSSWDSECPANWLIKIRPDGKFFIAENKRAQNQWPNHRIWRITASIINKSRSWAPQTIPLSLSLPVWLVQREHCIITIGSTLIFLSEFMESFLCRLSSGPYFITKHFVMNWAQQFLTHSHLNIAFASIDNDTCN